MQQLTDLYLMLPCNIDVTAVFLTSCKDCQVADVTYGSLMVKEII